MSHDWPQIIAEIASAYADAEGKSLSSYKLGLLIGHSNRTIELIASGSEPKHSIGESLLALRSELQSRTLEKSIEI